MADQEVYVVIGSTGAYSDHSYWFVYAYADKTLADEHAAKANDWLREWRLHEDSIDRATFSDGSLSYWEDATGDYRSIPLASPWDDRIEDVYFGARYDVEALPYRLSPIEVS